MIAGAKCPLNFTQSRKRFLLSLHYNGSKSLLIVNATKIYQFKAKDSEIKNCSLCLGWKTKRRVTSSNPRVTRSNPRVTSSNPRVTSSNPRVTSSDP